MPSFYVDSASQLADFLNNVTESMARSILNAVPLDSVMGTTAAIYYTDKHTEKRVSFAIYAANSGDGKSYFISTYDYHPRKDGKADQIFQAE